MRSLLFSGLLACRRVGVPDAVVKYQRVHVAIDHKHGNEWFDEVLQPLAAKSHALMRELCIGVLTRFNVATDYYNHVLTDLRGLAPPPAAV